MTKEVVLPQHQHTVLLGLKTHSVAYMAKTAAQSTRAAQQCHCTPPQEKLHSMHTCSSTTNSCKLCCLACLARPAVLHKHETRAAIPGSSMCQVSKLTETGSHTQMRISCSSLLLERYNTYTLSHTPSAIEMGEQALAVIAPVMISFN
jgi:hypothetical protein